MKDDGASEVIGVILIVVITLVVAALVAAFAFNMGMMKKSYQVYFTIDKPAPNDNISINNLGGTDLAFLKKIEISYTDATGVQTTFQTPDVIIAASGGHVSGDSNLLSQTSKLELDNTIVQPYGTCHVVVRGTFIDGTQQVLTTGDL